MFPKTIDVKYTVKTPDGYLMGITMTHNALSHLQLTRHKGGAERMDWDVADDMANVLKHHGFEGEVVRVASLYY